MFFSSKLEKYNKLYTALFSENPSNVNELCINIEKKYRDIIGKDKQKLFQQKVIVEEKINSLINIDMSPVLTAFISVLLTGAIPFFRDSLHMTYDAVFFILEFIIIYLLLFITSKIIDTRSLTYKRSFYKICLSILEKIEKEINNDNGMKSS